ncbi:eIF1-like protein [Aulographum hederae CBS 113979]|uniref:Translation machinery-associated protein 22 n=1 Tax=Aulographum hederae CBS 113979 TaxID=1176131 RepID=A0A6G1H8Z8_9PEZI|nr:eIF1-like protein [Aulographum hederae CBS 113979]
MAEAPPETAKHVVYCGVCSLPPEYCEFGGTTKKCEEWLQKEHPDMHERLYSEDALNANMATLSVEAQQRAEKDAKKKAAKAEAAEARLAEEKASAVVNIKRVERNKRKFVTLIQGLEAQGMDLKKTAKDMAKKFAASASVTKIPGGGEEITVQGDVADDVWDWLVEEKGVNEDNIEITEDKKKKGAA